MTFFTFPEFLTFGQVIGLLTGFKLPRIVHSFKSVSLKTFLRGTYHVAFITFDLILEFTFLALTDSTGRCTSMVCVIVGDQACFTIIIFTVKARYIYYAVKMLIFIVKRYFVSICLSTM